MKKIRFNGVPHAPALVIPHAVGDGVDPSVKPWRPGEIREVTDEAATRILADYAKAGALESPAFVLVEESIVTKPDGASVTKK